MGYVAGPDPENNFGYGWKSLKDWVQEYIRYCNDWGETPRSRSAVTEMFKKMGVLSRRRSDGVWYYLEQKPIEEEQPKPELNYMDDDDLPPDDANANLPF